MPNVKDVKNKPGHFGSCIIKMNSTDLCKQNNWVVGDILETTINDSSLRILLVNVDVTVFASAYQSRSVYTNFEWEDRKFDPGEWDLTKNEWKLWGHKQ